MTKEKSEGIVYNSIYYHLQMARRIYINLDCKYKEHQVLIRVNDFIKLLNKEKGDIIKFDSEKFEDDYFEHYKYYNGEIKESIDIQIYLALLCITNVGEKNQFNNSLIYMLFDLKMIFEMFFKNLELKEELKKLKQRSK